MKVFIKGLNSCTTRNQKLQQYCQFLIANGHEIVNDPSKSDVVLLWSCAFRKDWRDNSISEIQRYQPEYDSELVVAGCLPDIAPELLQDSFSDRIVNWRDDEEKMEKIFGGKAKLSQFLPVYAERKLCNDAEEYRKRHPDKDATFQDQFIKLVISEGCNFECTYCSERLAFPPFRSFPEDELVEACRRMVEETGELDVILLADNLGAYGSDIGSSLPALIRKLKGIHPSLKLALNNLSPAHFIQYYDDMASFLRSGDICHVNLPIQSASERILKLMNRPYMRADIDKIFGLLNSIRFTRFDTHLIIGFPGETEGDIEETVEFILHHRPRYVLLSGFMQSPGMVTCSLSNHVDEKTKHQRMRIAEALIGATGIICNTDDGKLSAERQRKLNLIKNSIFRRDEEGHYV